MHCNAMQCIAFLSQMEFASYVSNLNQYFAPALNSRVSQIKLEQFDSKGKSAARCKIIARRSLLK